MSTNSSEGSPSPVAPNAPKFGTLVPNRIFVGGISASTTEAELSALFSQYGNVKATKIISDRAGVSKGYGFITFETEEEAKRIQKEADNIVLKDRKLNIAPAIKKQPFTRVYNDPVQTTQNGTVMYSNGVPYVYVYQNGMALFSAASADNMYQVPAAQAAYSPVVYPQAIYIPQQYSYQASNPSLSTPQYYYTASPTAISSPTVSNPTNSTSTTSTTTTMAPSSSVPSMATGSGDAYSYPPPPGIPQFAAYYSQPVQPVPIEYAEPDDSSEVKPSTGRGKSSQSYSNHGSSHVSSPSKSYNSNRTMRIGANALLPTPSGSGDPSRTIRHIQGQQPHLVAKQVNGVTVMAYSNPIMMGGSATPPTTLMQLYKDGNQYEDPGNMTPPPTPVTPAGTPHRQNIFRN